MAKQIGIHKFSGTLGDVTGYVDPNDGPLLRLKTRLDKGRILRDPDFKRTLENAEEFRRATLGAAQLRHALSPLLQAVADGKLNGRMNMVFLKTIKSDETGIRGERCIQNGKPALLEGFNFNRDAKLANVFKGEYSGSIDAATGYMQVSIPSFIPKQILVPPPGAKYFQVVSIACSLDFVNERPKRYEQETGLYPIDRQLVPALQLQHAVTAEAGQFLFLVLGIVFYAVPEDIPAGLLSQRKRRRLGNDEAPVAYTGAAMMLKVAVATGPDSVSGNE